MYIFITQLRIGKNKTSEELKAIREIPSIKKELPTSILPEQKVQTGSRHGSPNSKGRMINPTE